MLMFDPHYFLIVGPAFLFSLIAQLWVKSAFAKWSRVGVSTRLSGAEAAERIVARAGLGVRVERVDGFLSDHYDPSAKVLRLSSAVYDGRSLASIGVAAHEAGHALQHARGYAPLQWRTAVVPAASIGSNLAWPLLIIGFFLHVAALQLVGIVLFSAVVLFQLITLPVEIDASRRALAIVRTEGIVTTEAEAAGARSVLTAAAMTYVAAAATAILTLVYFLMRSGILGGGRRD